MNILIFGAGRSSTYLISQLQQYCTKKIGKLIVIDQNFTLVPPVLKNHAFTTYVQTSVDNKEVVLHQIKKASIVISMLPPSLHLCIANYCLEFSKNLITASYASPQILGLHAMAQKKGLLFLNEVGVDPGLDHISALCLLDEIKQKGAIIKSFKSHTGGIVAQKKPNNLWNYKITWNPKNVIKAGNEGALFLKQHKNVYVPYQEIFSKTELVKIQHEIYDSYPNRNSLKYIDKYQLNNIETCYRGTLRHQGFCEAWNVLVQLGLTEDSQILKFDCNSTRQDFFTHFMPSEKETTKEYFSKLLNIALEHAIVKKLDQLDFFNNSKPLKTVEGTAAEILQSILEESWKIEASDKDMLLMHHEVDFELKGKLKKVTSSLKIEGLDSCFTAMAITVGATLFEAFKLVFEEKIKLSGVHIPSEKSLYSKLIQGVKSHKIVFEEVWDYN